MNFDNLLRKKEIDLRLKRLRDEDLDVVIEVLRKSKVLEKLDLGGNQLTLADGKITDALACNDTLKILILDGNHIGDDGAKRLADALKVNKVLEQLDLQENQLTLSDGRFTHALADNCALESLHLYSNRIGDKGANLLADALSHNRTLEMLWVDGNCIGVKGAKRLADSLRLNKTLQHIYLGYNMIGDKGVKHIADALKENESLEFIDLSCHDDNIGDEGAESLASCFMVNQSVREVNLSENNISDKGAEKLIESLKWNYGLEDIYTDFNSMSFDFETRIRETLNDPKREPVFIMKRIIAEREKEIATLGTALAKKDRQIACIRTPTEQPKNTSKHGVQAVPVSKKRRKRGTINTEEKVEMDGELVRKIMNDIVDSGEQVKFDDIAGLEVAKRIVHGSITCPMLRPDLFTGLRACPKGLLLFGPPGTGKTLIGKAIACESGATFFSVSSSSLTSKWEGDSEKLVRTMFDVAYHQAPSVIFMDEVDSLLTQRKSDESEASRRIKTEFLVQLDGVGNTREGQVLFIGATNRPQELDEGIRRRFEKRIYIPLPEQQARKALLQNLLAKNSNSLSDGQIISLSKDTEGFSGADLNNLCRDKAMGPIRDLGYDKAMSMAAEDLPPISYGHFQHSLSASNGSVAEEELVVYEEWNKAYGSS